MSPGQYYTYLGVLLNNEMITKMWIERGQSQSENSHALCPQGLEVPLVASCDFIQLLGGFLNMVVLTLWVG